MYLADMAEEFTGIRPKVHILEDNETCIRMTKEAKFTDANKHVNLCKAFCYEKVHNEEVYLHHIDSASNLSDIMTKGLGRIAHARIADVLLGVSSGMELMAHNEQTD